MNSLSILGEVVYALKRQKIRPTDIYVLFMEKWRLLVNHDTRGVASQLKGRKEQRAASSKEPQC